MAKDFEYNLDDLTRLMEEQELNPPPAQGARPKKKSKKSASAKTSEGITPPAISSEIELERTRQDNLKLQLEITKTQLELAKLTAPNANQQQLTPDHASSDLPLTNVLAASTPYRQFSNFGYTLHVPEGILHLTKPIPFLQ